MAEVQAIKAADLRTIETTLQLMHDNIEYLHDSVDTVHQNIRTVYDEVESLARQFSDYVTMQVRENELQKAEMRLIKIRQELETKYGHYAVVRRTTTGILQANDLGIVKKETISAATEELMLTTPGYWLAPCLVALAAWINDNRELSDRALAEGLRRDDEKTSLLFALICRRAGRKQASLKWVQRYLANQDEENLDRKCIIILDAFASGLLGADSEGVVSRQLGEWMTYLSEKPGFVEQQRSQWSQAINARREPMDDSEYPYLRKYSKTWPTLKNVMEGARLHANLYNYFESIFSQLPSTDALKMQLDEILDSLVTDFDSEELPLRKDENWNQLIVDYKGDVDSAKQKIDSEQTAFEERKDFTQLLTDAAMNPENSHSSISTQKFSIALSREWIRDAYNDVTATNRMQVPYDIDINIDNFNCKTVDGTNEQELLTDFNTYINLEKANSLKQYTLSIGMRMILPLALLCFVAGLIFMIGQNIMGLAGLIIGIMLAVAYHSFYSEAKRGRMDTEKHWEEKRNSGLGILRAVLAEVVDFRAEFQEKDAQSQAVEGFLDEITPEQYINKMSDTTRRIHAV